MTLISGFPESTWIIQTLGWTLFHFLWQSFLIALLVALTLTMMGRRSANARYLVACCGLLAMAVCPVVTFGWIHTNAGVRIAELETSTPAGPPGSNPGSANRSGATHPEIAFQQDLEGIPSVIPATNLSDLPNANSSVDEQSDAGVGQAGESLTSMSVQTNWMLNCQTRIQPVLPWLVTIWLTGVVLLSMRMLVCWSRVQRIKATGTSLPDRDTNVVFRRLKGRIKWNRATRLLQSTAVQVPTVIGWLRPVVLLPASVVTGLSTDQLTAVLAHELAHIRRGDYVINLFQSLVETILFYHPCVWWLSSRIRIERENCCDDLAAEVCGDPREYAETLLKLEQLKPSPTLALGANGGSLVDRVGRLLGTSPTIGKHPVWLAGIGSLMIAFVALSVLFTDQAAEAATRQDSSATTSDGGAMTEQEAVEARKPSMTVVVVDPEGNPMEGAHIHAGIWSHARTFPPNQMNDTDATGRVTIELPDEFYILRLWASADGHTRLFANWEEDEIKSGDKPPSEYTFRMITGTEIGGVIQNENGEPVVGAQIGIQASATHPDGGSRLRYGTWYAESQDINGDNRLVTDGQGRWSLNTLPPAEDLEITLTVSHEDYIDDNDGSLQKAQGITTAQFREQAATIVMQTGVAIAGVVTDASGDPVREGLVVWGDRPYWNQGIQEVRIRSDGSYELPPLPPGEKRITVIVPGLRPETRIVDIHSMLEPVDFELAIGSRISILIVDGKTNVPIPDAYAGISGWRGGESIYNHQHPNVINSGIPWRANAGGLYQWNWAPDDEVTYQIEAAGYSPKFRVPLTASDESHVVKLYKPLAISGSVVDKKTGESIKDFRVVPLKYSDPKNYPDRFHQQTRDAVAGRSGRFRISMRMEGSYKLGIEADGYKTLVTDMYATGDDVPRLKLEMETAAWRRGQVIDAGGLAVQEASVHWSSGTQTVSLRNYINNDSARRQITDEEGKFSFPQSDEPYTLVVVHGKGHAEVVRQPNEEIGPVTIHPWASAEGVVLDEAGKPAVGVRMAFEGVRFQYDHIFHIQDMTVVETDNTGRYRFPKLPPIRGTIRPLVHMTDALRNQHNVAVDLQPDEHRVINFGEKGVEVSGTLKLVGGSSAATMYSTAQVTMIPVAEPPFGLPIMLQRQNYDGLKGWPEVVRATRDNNFWVARTYLASFDHYEIKPDASGNFSIRIAEPGTYDAGVRLKARTPNTATGVFTASRGEGSVRFTIDDETYKSGELDLGEIEIQAFPDLAVGSDVPDFPYSNADGATVQFRDQRGHYVMLDFWAGWCEVCEADKPKLQQLAKQLEKENSTARMISVEYPAGGGNFTRAPEPTRKVWTGGKLIYGPGTQPAMTYAEIYKSLGVWAVPRYLIVDPDGKLVYHGDIDGAMEKMNEVK